jgi:hypothetical protein
MDGDDDGVMEAARAVRPYLSALLGPDEAAVVDRELAGVLSDESGKTIRAERTQAILETRPDTAWFLRRVLEDGPLYRPPYEQPVVTRGIIQPAGDPGLVVADRFACPRGDYVWYRPDVGTPVPECPDHHIALIRS